MGTKYATVTVSGYNSSAPPDDGSQVASNQITWSKSKTKLGDPLKTALEAINSTLVTALDSSVRAVTANDTTTAADHFKTIQCTATSAGFTVSLGDAVTMAAGYIVTVHNRASSTGDVTVALASAADSINNTTNGTRLLPPGSALQFVVASPASGYVVIGSDGVLKSPYWVESSGALKRMTFAGGISFPAIAAKGDIFGASAAGAFATLTVGTTGRVLNADSTQTSGLAWRDAIVQGTPVTSLSGTSIDFTSLPNWAKRVTVHFSAVSTSGTSGILIQIGDSGGIENTGYVSASIALASGAVGTVTSSTAGFLCTSTFTAANALHGSFSISLMDSSNTWTGAGTPYITVGNLFISSGTKALSATLDRIRITTAGGADTFDAGTINVTYE